MLWSISLLVISIATLINAVAGIMGYVLPDMLVRGLGIATLIALPLFIYATVKKMKKEKKD